MSVYVKNNDPSGIVYDNKTTSQIDGEGPGEYINSGSSVLSTLYEISPETQWVDWNPSTNEFGKVSSVGVGAGCLVIGNPDDVTSGQAWITNYDGTWWDRVVPSLYTGQSGKFGTHIELGKNKILLEGECLPDDEDLDFNGSGGAYFFEGENLYITIGIPTATGEKTSMLAQDEKSIYGKILKINK